MSIEDDIQVVEQDLDRLRGQEREIREQIGDMGATDQIEVSAMIEQADELVELIAGLERRRDRLRERQQKEGAQ